jgi:hypothetical protein
LGNDAEVAGVEVADVEVADVEAGDGASPLPPEALGPASPLAVDFTVEVDPTLGNGASLARSVPGGVEGSVTIAEPV